MTATPISRKLSQEEDAEAQQTTDDKLNEIINTFSKSHNSKDSNNTEMGRKDVEIKTVQAEEY